ncbi:MAG: acyl-CoA dehydratase activase [Desulfobacterales bacterium]|jgi:predicted CoA-substrate-specific enzyme activase|nr:acyl-CoA dehydratase activase [Desulfobacterales bacterium]
MILGCDIGTGYTKAVLMEEGKVLFAAKTPTQAHPDGALARVLSELRQEGGDKVDSADQLVITGWGQGKVSRPHRGEPLIKCMGRAGVWAEPTCRTMLCLGTQQSYALTVNHAGRVLQYRVNDKCASGAGKFLEVICEALECTVQDTAGIAKTADRQVNMSSQCAVFAESEVVSLVNDGESVANILDSILRALTQNIVTLCKRVKLEETVVIAGGLANNERIVALLREAFPVRTQVFGTEPDYVGAIGAALSVNGGGL